MEDETGSLENHPGSLIRDLAQSRGITDQQKLADLLGVSRIGVNRLLRGKRAVSPLMALRLEAVFGEKAGKIMEKQTIYDLERAYQENRAELERIRRGSDSSSAALSGQNLCGEV